MTEPNTQPARKTAFYWIVTLLAWAMVAFLVGMAIWSLLHGDIVSFIGFLLFAACFLIAMFQPKWFQRFANWYTNVRGL